MAIGSVNPGYTGYAVLEDVDHLVRFTDASVNVRQELNAPDIIMGHWDHNAYVFGPIEIGGSMAGPITENFAGDTSGLWAWGTKRSGDCGLLDSKELTLHYYCDRSGATSGKSRTFPDMLVNSIGFSCSAGDIAQFTIDLLGAGQPTPPSWGTYTRASDYNLEEKLLTWDQVQVAVTAGDQDIGTLNSECFSNFDFSINNNLETVYAICSGANYFPFDIVPGLRTITGTLASYNIPEVNAAFGYNQLDAPGGTWAAANTGTITFTLGTGNEFTFNVRFHRVEATSSVGPIISSIGFTGVGEQATLDS